MALNTGALAGKTVFITGASRGIGKAIALKCAKDRANVVIAAKTTTEGSKLPGTIFSAAKEVEEAGGQCLPCVVDVRDPTSVKAAVDSAVARFGSIDVLVNNASAINLNPTHSTSMKWFDLMTSINVRGTYLCSMLCLPHLLKSSNAHIVTISPPLSFKPQWLSPHIAYTFAKYGMSMCVEGLALQLQSRVGVNAIWPRTAIETAAIKMLAGGDEDVFKNCRKPEIMADATYLLITSEAAKNTGKIWIDEDLIRLHGITDLDQYANSKDAELLMDFFVDGVDFKQFSSKAKAAPPMSEDYRRLSDVFMTLSGMCTPEVVQKVNGVYQFLVSGIEQTEWHIDLKHGNGSIGPGPCPNSAPNATFIISCNDLLKIISGQMSSRMAFASGRLKVDGDLILAMKLDALFKKFKDQLQ